MGKVESKWHQRGLAKLTGLAMVDQAALTGRHNPVQPGMGEGRNLRPKPIISNVNHSC